jgi:hypothetical protein
MLSANEPISVLRTGYDHFCNAAVLTQLEGRLSLETRLLTYLYLTEKWILCKHARSTYTSRTRHKNIRGTGLSRYIYCSLCREARCNRRFLQILLWDTRAATAPVRSITPPDESLGMVTSLCTQLGTCARHRVHSNAFYVSLCVLFCQCTVHYVLQGRQAACQVKTQG